MHHNLKLDVRFFQAVIDGKRRSEVRFNDRDYRVGDTLTLHEGQLDNGEFSYSGRCVSAEVSFIDTFGLQEGYVSLSLHKVGLLII